MKKKKGFSLVELLAVIIILAILALILIPLVNKMIISARRGAAVDSTYGYIKAVEYYRLNLVELDTTEDDVDTLNPLVKAEGKLPTAGYVIYSSKGLTVELAKICINGYSVKYVDGRAAIAEDETYCVLEPTYVEPDGDYIRELCEGTKTFNSNVVYKMKTAEDLACFSKVIKDNTYFASSRVIMVSDIDLANNKSYLYKTGDNSKMYGDINEDGTISDLKTELTTGKGFYPIGKTNTSNKYFSGTLEGNNFTLKNLMINRPSETNTGLFGYFGGTISNMKFDNTNGKTDSSEFTTLAGGENTGFIVGTNFGSIIGCTVKGKVSGTTKVGGLVGYINAYQKVIKENHLNVEVTGTGNQVGGIVGRTEICTIQDNWVTSKVTGTNYVGGIAGYHQRATIVENVIDYSEVTGNQYVGGAVGYLGDYSYTGYLKGILIKNIKVTGNSSTGGAVGKIYYGQVNGVLIENGTVNRAALYENLENGSVSNMFYMPDLTPGWGQDLKYLVSTKNVNAYENAIDTIIAGDNDATGYYFRQDKDGVFQLVKTSDYPIDFTLSGNGSSSSPYLISTPEEWNMATTKANLSNTYFKLTANLDFTGKEFYKMGGPRNQFAGIIDGDNHTISGISIDGGAYNGLIGYSASTGTIKNIVLTNNTISNSVRHTGFLIGQHQGPGPSNVTITNSNITGNGSYAGGAIGYNTATVSGVTISGVKVSGSSYIGGLIGYSYNYNAEVKENHVNVEVEATGNNVGGLLGYMGPGTAKDNWVTSKVTGNDCVGGVVGYHVRGTLTETDASTDVTGNSQVGGLVGYLGDYNVGTGNVTGNLLKNTKVVGSSQVGGIAGKVYYGNINGAIIESGSSNGNSIVGNCDRSCYYSNTYYLPTFTTQNQDLKYLVSTKNVNAYENAVDTWIGGDNDSAGYYFKQDSNGIFQLVKTSDNPMTFTLSGNGSSASPYLISTPEEWNMATLKATLANTYFKLTANLDFTGKEFYKMGGPRNQFAGIIDGDNHTITGISIDGGAYNGLIGYSASTGTIKNIVLTNNTISNSSRYTGFLIGQHQGPGPSNVTITNSTITGNGSYAGGAIGYNIATVSGITISGVKVSGSSYIGGLIGYNYNYNSEIKENHVNVEVEATGNNVGGLLGYMGPGTAKDNWVTSKVTGNDCVGGVVGYHVRGTLTETDASTDVTGNSQVGGLVGYLGDYNVGTGNVNGNILKNTKVVGSSQVGGIAGKVYYGNINGAIIESGSSNGNSIVGNCDRSCYYSNTYYLPTFTTQNQDLKYLVNTKNINAYENAVDTWIAGDNDATGYYFRQDSNGVFQLVKTSDYPMTFTLSGSGSSSDPYLISTAEEWNMATLKATLANTYFKLTANLDFTGKEFYKMGGPRNQFAGVIDGDNHTITGISIDGGAYNGLIGYTTTTGTIRNVVLTNNTISNSSRYTGFLIGQHQGPATSNITITNSNITGTGSYAGGAVGYNTASVSGITISGVKVYGSSYIGGLIGYSYNYSAEVKENHVNVEVEATGNNVGGLLGYTGPGSIKVNWVTSKVKGNDYVGGVVGYHVRGSLNETVAITDVTGNSQVGGLVGYLGDYNVGNGSVSGNLLKNTKVVGNSQVGGAAGKIYYGTLEKLVIENGTSSGNTSVGNCDRSCSYSNIYYLSNFTPQNQSTKVSSSYYNNLTKYDEILETAYDGDTNSTGWFYGYNTNGIIDLVQQNNEPSVTPCTENCPTDDELETVVDTGTGTCTGDGADTTPPTCSFIRSYPVSNGIGAEFTCTDNSGAPEVASLFNSTTNIVYSYDDILARGSIKTGTVSGNTRSINSRWTTSYAPNQPQPGLCYYYQYGAKDSCGNWTTYTTKDCYYGFSN